MEDYRILNNDQKKIKEDFKKREVLSEMGHGLKVRKSLFSQYPKFLRCHETLFPNNYLDIIELKDKEKLLDVYYQFNEIIMNLDTKERDILNFINESNDHRFIIGSLLKVFFPFGHHEAHIFSEFQLGTSYKVDYLLIGRNSHGWHFVFVELEAIQGSITTKNGDFASVLRKGESQIKDWELWLEKNFNLLKENFLKKTKLNQALPKEFYEFDRTRVHYMVVAGKRSDFTERTYRLIREKKLHNMHFIHYDNLMDSCDELITSNYLTY